MKKFLTLFAALLFSVGAAAQNETATMIETPHIKAPEGAFLSLGLPAHPVRIKYAKLTILCLSKHTVQP